jgi:hypothetical protein
MNAIIERVARAIDPQAWANWDSWVSMKDYTPEEAAEEFARSRSLQSSITRAEDAICALHDPTDIMVRTGAEILVYPSVYQEGAPDSQKKKASMMFSAMIDAAFSMRK